MGGPLRTTVLPPESDALEIEPMFAGEDQYAEEASTVK
jgi:hypothetical protein